MQESEITSNLTRIIEQKIRTIPDFPKVGIQFKDITPLMSNSETLSITSRLLTKLFMDNNVDLVIGIESRGFLFGPIMAMNLHAGFIPVRKPNKLPAETISESYELEYGTDSLEIHKDAIKKGDKVLIHDDLIATGGSAAATTRLVEKLGGEVVGYSFLIELGFLNGKSQLSQDVNYQSLISI